jgi:outer membrane protein OmpA-like peptidoglycan-associated protein
MKMNRVINNIFLIAFVLFVLSCSSNKNMTNERDLPKLTGVTIRNLGYNVNTEYDDYGPAISGNAKMLYFTSTRPNPYSTKPGDEDIWYCTRSADGWKQARNLGAPVNSKGNQGLSAFQPDGHYIYIAMDTKERDDGYGNLDIYYSKFDGNKWTETKNMGPDVNSPWWDSQPTISSDGRMLIFSSNRPGGFGKSDLWVSIQNDSGKWSKPINLGASINSSDDEFAPFLTLDNKTLYFSSTGKPNFGGKDIFVSQYDDGTWSPRQNLGSPYNSEEDDFLMSVPAANDTAYFCSNRPGTVGGLDIWLAFPPPKYQPVVVAVTGIVSEFNSKPKKFIEADMVIKDLNENKIVSEFKSNAVTGEYYIILTRGRNYGITAKATGYLFFTNHFEIPADATFKELRKDIELFPIRGDRPSVRLMVFFDYDKATLRPESFADLQNAIDFLQKNPNIHIEIAGHTDKRGTDEYNDKLSQERATSVASYIITNGKIDPMRVRPVGYGKRKLIFDGDTEEIHQVNRRVEMVLIKY